MIRSPRPLPLFLSLLHVEGKRPRPFPSPTADRDDDEIKVGARDVEPTDVPPGPSAGPGDGGDGEDDEEGEERGEVEREALADVGHEERVKKEDGEAADGELPRNAEEAADRGDARELRVRRVERGARHEREARLGAAAPEPLLDEAREPAPAVRAEARAELLERVRRGRHRDLELEGREAVPRSARREA